MAGGLNRKAGKVLETHLKHLPPNRATSRDGFNARRIHCHPAALPFIDTVAVDGNIRSMILQATSKFRQRLRNEMQLQGVSQRELAKRAGTSYAGVNRILQGKQDPTLELADRLSDALGIELAKFLEKTSPKKKKTA